MIPIIEKEAAASLFDAGAQVVFTGADTPAVADVAQEKGKWGVTYDWYWLLQSGALPDRSLLELGSDLCRDYRKGDRWHVQTRLGLLRCRYRRVWVCMASWKARN